jgi:hypothetical protein
MPIPAFPPSKRRGITAAQLAAVVSAHDPQWRGQGVNGGKFHLFRRPFGRRCLVLLLFGGLWIVIGISTLLNRVDRFSANGPDGPLQFMDDPPLAGVMWIVGGATAVIFGILRPYLRQDGFGFHGLAIPPFLWALFYVYSWFLNVTSNGEAGRETAFVGAIVYGTVATMVLFIADWPDPDEPFPPTCAEAMVRDPKEDSGGAVAE